jgi:hypothetical protein
VLLCMRHAVCGIKQGQGLLTYSAALGGMVCGVATVMCGLLRFALL